MRPGHFLLFFSTLVILAAGCRNDLIVEETPTLKSVVDEEVALEIPNGGTAELHFMVKDELFRFAGALDVVLAPTSAQSKLGFALTELHSEEREGHYVAVLKDNGGSEDYSVEMRLGIREKPRSESMLLSSPFIVRSIKEKPAYMKTGLPVVYLNTRDGVQIRSKTEWVQASMRIDQDQYSCSVRGRGNTTWEWPKKPYAIKLEKKASLFGMPAHKRWVLLANFMDRTLMRNIVSMKVASLTALDWSPSCVSVELVLNGRHMGNYLLIEQVRVDENRVPVDEKEGLLLELDFHYDNEIQWIDPHGSCWQRSDGIPFGIKHPDAEDLTLARVQQVKDYVSEVARTIYSSDFADPSKGYARYLDMDSFVDYWIVFEVMGNHELSNPGSVYMHRDKGGKLIAGPCWDFDWGILSYKSSPQARDGLINRWAIWYSRLFEDPAFRARVKARYEELLPALRKIPAFMEETEAMLEKSAELNFKMWNPAGDATMNGGQIVNGDENMSFHNASVLLRSNFEERLVVIRKCL